MKKNTFERVQKIKARSHLLGENTITINKMSVGFGKNVSKSIKEKGCVEIYLDRENNRVGFRPTKNRYTGFSLMVKNRTYSGTISFSEGRVVNQMKRGAYEAVKEEDMWVIEGALK